MNREVPIEIDPPSIPDGKLHHWAGAICIPKTRRYSTACVLVECESVSLSTSVPIFARWLVTGIVEGVAKDALEGTLKRLRKFLVG